MHGEPAHICTHTHAHTHTAVCRHCKEVKWMVNQHTHAHAHTHTHTCTHTVGGAVSPAIHMLKPNHPRESVWRWGFSAPLL